MTTKHGHPLGGIDLGGTKILSVVLAGDGSVLGEDLRPTLADEGPAAVIGRMVASLRKSLRIAGVDDEQLHAIGVCAPGPIDIAKGVITTAANLPGWRDVPLASIIKREFDASCRLENDANAAAIAEHRWGAGRGSRDMLFLTVSSGIGGGIIINGEIYRGKSGASGEVGHMSLNPRGPRCGCGRRGCLEAYASGLGLTREAKALVRKRPDSLLTQMAATTPLSGRLLHDAADAGDEGAIELIATAGRYLGIGLANLINIFDPEIIVLGGSLTKMGDLYLGPMRESVASESYPPQAFQSVRIVVGELGDRAPALGAAAIGQESSLRR